MLEQPFDPSRTLEPEAQSPQERTGSRAAQPGRQAQLEVAGHRGHQGGRVGRHPADHRALDAGSPQEEERELDVLAEHGPVELPALAARRNGFEEGPGVGQGLLETRVWREAPLGHQPHRPQHAQGILAQAIGGIAHAAKPPRFEVVDASVRVDQLGGRDAQGHGSHAEVALGEIVRHVRAAPQLRHVDRGAASRDRDHTPIGLGRHTAREELETPLDRRGSGELERDGLCPGEVLQQALADEPAGEALGLETQGGLAHRVGQAGVQVLSLGGSAGHGHGILAGTIPRVAASGSSSTSLGGGGARPRAAFRAPGTALPLGELLGRGWPQLDASARDAWIGRGIVQIDGRPARKPTTVVQPGRWVGLWEDVPEPALEIPEAPPEFRVLIPFLPWRRGVLARRRGMRTGIVFERQGERDRLCELIVRPETPDVGTSAAAFLADVRRVLAESGSPVLADVRYGGILVAGGIRVRVNSSETGGWWPDEPVFPGDDGDDPASLGVSAATARIVGRGHPWVLRDDDTEDPSHLAPGTRVQLRGPGGEELGTASVEGAGRITARVWESGRPRSVEARVAAALARRKKLLEPAPDAPVTDAYRLVHGEADGLPGIFVDRLGGLLRVLVTSPGTSSYRERALDALVHGLKSSLGDDPPVVEVMHLRDRPPGELACTQLVRGRLESAAGRLVVRERGVRFRVDAGLDRPMRSSPGVGLYLDQRANRERLVRGGARGRLLNLFAHTGAFSVAWLAGGGSEAVSVDLSRPYLRWLDDNLGENGIEPDRHRGVRQDGRRYLETLARRDRFDAIVIDPPTAAAAGRRFWSVGKELPPLVERAFAHLGKGGRLLVSRNDRGSRSLDEIVARAAEAAGVELSRVEPARPGTDFPRLAGFPEGDSFSAVLASRA